MPSVITIFALCKLLSLHPLPTSGQWFRRINGRRMRNVERSRSSRRTQCLFGLRLNCFQNRIATLRVWLVSSNVLAEWNTRLRFRQGDSLRFSKLAIHITLCSALWLVFSQRLLPLFLWRWILSPFFKDITVSHGVRARFFRRTFELFFDEARNEWTGPNPCRQQCRPSANIRRQCRLSWCCWLRLRAFTSGLLPRCGWDLLGWVCGLLANGHGGSPFVFT